MPGEGGILKLSELHEEVKARGYPHSVDTLGMLLNRRADPLGSGNKREYGWADVRYTIVWYRWMELTVGNAPRAGGGRTDAHTAGGLARYYPSGWVVKSQGRMFQTTKPETHLKWGLVAVPLEVE